MLLLAFMGLRLIFEPYMKKKEEAGTEYAIGMDKTKSLKYREAISVGTALALDDIGGSMSVGLVGYNPFMVGFAFFVVSYLIFLSGNYLIKYTAKLKIGNKATIISGIILIIIGITQAIE
jgi:putative Mn2+ efflux pump MntP